MLADGIYLKRFRVFGLLPIYFSLIVVASLNAQNKKIKTRGAKEAGVNLDENIIHGKIVCW